jgi:hypothetical protein
MHIPPLPQLTTGRRAQAATGRLPREVRSRTVLRRLDRRHWSKAHDREQRCLQCCNK